VRNLQNPYAWLSILDPPDEDSQVPTEAQKHAYYRNLQNPCAHDAIFGIPEDEAAPPKVPTSTTVQLPPEFQPVTKEVFDSECRRILLQYVPQAEGRRLRPHYREFIDRLRNESPELRGAILFRLRRYDLATSGQFQPHFNRERQGLSMQKLAEIESQARNDASQR
jgi:hypothetical protein